MTPDNLDDQTGDCDGPDAAVALSDRERIAQALAHLSGFPRSHMGGFVTREAWAAVIAARDVLEGKP